MNEYSGWMESKGGPDQAPVPAWDKGHQLRTKLEPCWTWSTLCCMSLNFHLILCTYLCMYVCIGHWWKGTALSHRKEKQKTKEIGGHALAAHVATQRPDNWSSPRARCIFRILILSLRSRRVVRGSASFLTSHVCLSVCAHAPVELESNMRQPMDGIGAS
jgi:hypothetical protein